MLFFSLLSNNSLLPVPIFLSSKVTFAEKDGLIIFSFKYLNITTLVFRMEVLHKVLANSQLKSSIKREKILLA